MITAEDRRKLLGILNEPVGSDHAAALRGNEYEAAREVDSMPSVAEPEPMFEVIVADGDRKAWQRDEEFGGDPGVLKKWQTEFDPSEMQRSERFGRVQAAQRAGLTVESVFGTGRSVDVEQHALGRILDFWWPADHLQLLKTSGKPSSEVELWEESKHPRKGKGQKGGGQFTRKGEEGGGAVEGEGLPRRQREIPAGLIASGFATVPPAAPETFFKYDPGDESVQHVDPHELRVTRARPEGIVNASNFMSKLANGEYGDEDKRREPISVVKHPNGGYEVIDGNSTAHAAQYSNLEKVAVRVFPNREAAKAHEAEKDMDWYVDPHRDFSASEMSMAPYWGNAPDESDAVVHEGVNSKEEAYQQAAQALPKFLTTLDTGQGLSARIGGESITPDTMGQEGFDFVGSIKNSIGSGKPLFLLPPLKGEKRASEKAENMAHLNEREKAAGGWNRVNDLVRGTVAVESLKQIKPLIAALRTELQKNGWEIAAQPRDRFNKPTGGYRDMQLMLKSPEGHICELQIHTKAYLYSKEMGGHLFYEIGRAIQDHLKSQGGGNPMHPALQGIIEAQNAYYDRYGLANALHADGPPPIDPNEAAGTIGKHLGLTAQKVNELAKALKAKDAPDIGTLLTNMGAKVKLSEQGKSEKRLPRVMRDNILCKFSEEGEFIWRGDHWEKVTGPNEDVSRSLFYGTLEADPTGEPSEGFPDGKPKV